MAIPPGIHQIPPAELMESLIESPERFGLPKVRSVAPATGGVVHHVWAIETDNARFYAKIRADRLVGVPEIQCEPQDIQYEAKALALFKAVAPDLFPTIVYCSPTEGVLILTDVVSDGKVLQDLLLAGAMTSKIALRLGETIRRIHDQAKLAKTEIRGQREELFARTKLEHKLGPAQHASTAVVMRRLRTDVQPIIGDLSPKNIAYHASEQRFTFFDLEDAHFGHPGFDVGFLVGHLLLHNYRDARSAEYYVNSFLNGYGQRSFDDLAQFVAAATFHYRLNSIIPYCVVPSETQRSQLLRNASAIMTRISANSVTWDEVIRNLLA
jgi:hypothetical protein